MVAVLVRSAKSHLLFLDPVFHFTAYSKSLHTSRPSGMSAPAATFPWRIPHWAMIRGVLLLTICHARSDYSPRPSHHHRSPDRSARRFAVCDCGIRSHQTSALNRESLSTPCTKSPRRDRLIAGFCSLWNKPTRLFRLAIALKPSPLLNFHRALVQRKYRLLFSPKRRAKLGLRGPAEMSFAPSSI